MYLFIKSTRSILSHICFSIFLFLCACGGGGGGGGNDSKGGNDDSNSNKPTSRTAVRLINSSVDAVPIGVSSNGVFLYQSSYMGSTQFAPIGQGANTISLSVATRTTDVLRAFNIDALDKTEYTVFYYGTDRDKNVSHKVFVEPVVKPAKGFSRIQVLHGLSDVSRINAQIAPGVSQSVSFGESSGFIDLPSGDYIISISASGGGMLVQPTVNLPDQGEVTLVVSGKLDYDFVTVKSYVDFD